MKRQLLLKGENEQTILVETEFDNRFLEEAAIDLDDDNDLSEFSTMDDMMNIVNKMADKGYLKVLGNGPEILDLLY